MIQLKEIDNQLAKIGMKNRFWGRPEVHELCHILVPGEQIIQAVNGQYDGGFALLLATDRRLLLIDKKPWFLTMEDIRYDMISEVDYYGRLIDATVSIVTLNKTLHFKSIRQTRLREMTRYVQHRVMQLRQQDYQQWQHTHDEASFATAPAQGQTQPSFERQFQTKAAQTPPVPTALPTKLPENKRTWTQALAQAAGRVAMKQAQRLRPLRVFPYRPLVMRRRYTRFYGTSNTNT